ncbi:MAG: cyclase family protein [Bacteroidetes bacterium]|nr:cyclase family protein [Bacteroidota bacterium]
MEVQLKHLFIDLSYPVDKNITVYPGDQPPQLEKTKDYFADGFSNYRISCGMHTGTHIDGPMHLTESDRFIADFPPACFIGTGCLLNAAGAKNIFMKPEFASKITPESIVLIYTGFGKKFGSREYYNDHPVISKELACFFIQLRIKMICLDFPSPDKPPYEIHKLFLNNSILIGENLANMDKLLEFRKFEVIALPLSLHADSSPARIIARIIE